jgi:hypothetical protein
LKNRESFGSDDKPEEMEKVMTQTTLEATIEYLIVAVPFHADAASHEELARKVNDKLRSGYNLFGTPFLSAEMMYQPMTRALPRTSCPTAS